MRIASKLHALKETLPLGVELVAVSKFHPCESILEAYNAGQRSFGESRMQELQEKQAVLPKDIQWHFIGHLQTNKVKAIIPYIHTIHSVDSWKLLAEIEKQAALLRKEVSCLLEIHIAQEDTKTGFSLDECKQFLATNDWHRYKYAHIHGIMGMASNTNDENRIRTEFKELKKIYTVLRKDYFADNPLFAEISMGMSNDYQIAVEEGATLIRVGSSIFGDREY